MYNIGYMIWLKRYLIVVCFVIVVLGVYVVVRIVQEDPVDVPVVPSTALYGSNLLGVEFEYKTGLDGYVVQEVTSSDENAELQRTFVVIRERDLENISEESEGPPTITMSVFKNTENQQPSEWINLHTQYSNSNLKIGGVRDVMIDGISAIRYMADGLYMSDNVVVTYGEYVYVITGMFVDEGSDIRRDFEPLLDSIRFSRAVEER